MREIRMLRARRRGLETESRIILPGHEGGNPGYRQGRSYGHRASPRPYQGNPGYRQGRSYGPPRQFPTLPGTDSLVRHRSLKFRLRD